jgi:hypothetical protein
LAAAMASSMALSLALSSSSEVMLPRFV